MANFREGTNGNFFKLPLRSLPSPFTPSSFPFLPFYSHVVSPLLPFYSHVVSFLLPFWSFLLPKLFPSASSLTFTGSYCHVHTNYCHSLACLSDFNSFTELRTLSECFRSYPIRNYPNCPKFQKSRLAPNIWMILFQHGMNVYPKRPGMS